MATPAESEFALTWQKQLNNAIKVFWWSAFEQLNSYLNNILLELLQAHI